MLLLFVRQILTQIRRGRCQGLILVPLPREPLDQTACRPLAWLLSGTLCFFLGFGSPFGFGAVRFVGSFLILMAVATMGYGILESHLAFWIWTTFNHCDWQQLPKNTSANSGKLIPSSSAARHFVPNSFTLFARQRMVPAQHML